MNPFSNPRVTRRFVILMAVATFIMFGFWAALRGYLETPAGDFEVRQGDILLGDAMYGEALERFDAALAASPDHRGALMGRALVFLQSGRLKEAEAEFTYMIDFLNRTLTPEDRTGIGTLAAAYNNRGILYDRQCRHKEALDDYIWALRIDEGAVEGPGIVDKIIYGTPRPATARTRAKFLYENLENLKPGECLTLPEKDAEQRMYKP
jgi:tetratricopeptide (TPR) repeat protein